MLLAVETSRLAAFEKALPGTGCTLVRTCPRSGRDSAGVAFREVEVALPQTWRRSMSDALHSLPGVLRVGDVIRLVRPSRVAALLDRLAWKFGTPALS